MTDPTQPGTGPGADWGDMWETGPTPAPTPGPGPAPPHPAPTPGAEVEQPAAPAQAAPPAAPPKKKLQNKREQAAAAKAAAAAAAAAQVPPEVLQVIHRQRARENATKPPKPGKRPRGRPPVIKADGSTLRDPLPGEPPFRPSREVQSSVELLATHAQSPTYPAMPRIFFGREQRLTNPEFLGALLVVLESGATIADAKKILGIMPTRWAAWQAARTGKTASAFKRLIARAQAIARQKALDAITSRSSNWNAAAWFLERRFPSRYGQTSRIDQRVRGDHTIDQRAVVGVGRVDFGMALPDPGEVQEQILAIAQQLQGTGVVQAAQAAARPAAKAAGANGHANGHGKLNGHTNGHAANGNANGHGANGHAANGHANGTNGHTNGHHPGANGHAAQ